MLGTWGPQPSKACEFLRLFLASTFPKFYFRDSADPEFEYKKQFPFGEKFSSMMRESGYMHLQATKPDTPGAALIDSPAGLAAYILEKFSTWTNFNYVALEDGGLTKKFTLDELLTNVMIYWTSNNVAASMRYYKENIPDALNEPLFSEKLTVPAGVVDPAYELMHTPRKLFEPYFEQLVQYTDFPRGGHFTALEEPKLVSEDIRTFVHKVRKIEAAKKEQAKAANKKTEM